MMVRLHAFTYVELNLDSPWLYCSIESFLQTHTHMHAHTDMHIHTSRTTFTCTRIYTHSYPHSHTHTHTLLLLATIPTGKGTGIYVWCEDNSTQFLHFISLHFQYNVAGTQSLCERMCEL